MASLFDGYEDKYKLQSGARCLPSMLVLAKSGEPDALTRAGLKHPINDACYWAMSDEFLGKCGLLRYSRKQSLQSLVSSSYEGSKGRMQAPVWSSA